MLKMSNGDEENTIMYHLKFIIYKLHLLAFLDSSDQKKNRKGTNPHTLAWRDEKNCFDTGDIYIGKGSKPLEIEIKKVL